ncbi:MAG TPA: hypothetical protein DCX52_11720 [Massilia sp.]|nr:hypothetical protein [Massilia sp.]
MKVVQQLAKEFFGPFFGALAWAAFNHQGDIKQSFTLFGGTFFFISWLTGQFFRVKKQTATEGSLHAIRNDVQGLLNELKAKTEDLAGQITGGESFAYIFNPLIVGSEARIMISHDGKYPLFDVSAGVADVRELDEKIKTIGHVEAFLAARVRVPLIEVLLPGMTKITDAKLNLGPSGEKSFIAHIKARNGLVIQRMRFVRIDGTWRYATVVHKAGEQDPCYKFTDSGFPVNKDGAVNWSSFEAK